MSDVTIQIEREIDIIAARQAGRQLAGQLGFSSTDQTLIATAISEVAAGYWYCGCDIDRESRPASLTRPLRRTPHFR